MVRTASLCKYLGGAVAECAQDGRWQRHHEHPLHEADPLGPRDEEPLEEAKQWDHNKGLNDLWGEGIVRLRWYEGNVESRVSLQEIQRNEMSYCIALRS